MDLVVLIFITLVALCKIKFYQRIKFSHCSLLVNMFWIYFADDFCVDNDLLSMFQFQTVATDLIYNQFSRLI